MSPLPKGTPCYALIWEGAIGDFYEIDADLNVTLVADVLNQPDNRYAQLYGLADPTFPKDSLPRLSDAGKLMALASFSTRSVPTAEEHKLLELLPPASRREISLPQKAHSTGTSSRRCLAFREVIECSQEKGLPRRGPYFCRDGDRRSVSRLHRDASSVAKPRNCRHFSRGHGPRREVLWI